MMRRGGLASSASAVGVVPVIWERACCSVAAKDEYWARSRSLTERRALRTASSKCLIAA